MTLLRNTFEGGTNGTNITVGNSGGASGDAFGSGEVARDGSAVLQYSNAHPSRGVMSALVSGAVGENSLMGLILASASKQVAAQCVLYLTAAPTVNVSVMQFRDSGYNLEVVVQTTRKVFLTDDAGASIAGLGSASALPLNTFILLDARVEVGTTTSNGKVYWQYTILGDASPTESLSSTAVNLGTANLTRVRFGKATTAGAITGMYVDDVAVADGVTAFIAPPANALPTANAGSDQTIAAGSNLVLSGSGSDADGTITSYAWTKVSGPAVTVTTPTAATAGVTAIPAGHYTFRLTVTDDGGATASDDVNVYVTTSTAVADAVVSNAGWTTDTGSSADADLIAATADASDTTWIESPDNPSGVVIEQRMQPLAPGQVAVPYRVGADVASPARTCKVELMMGGTTIASKAEALTTAITAGSFTLTPTQLSALTGRTDLRLRYTAS